MAQVDRVVERFVTMTKDKAYQKDKKYEFYADHDEDAGGRGVFGGDTGFCYDFPGNKERAMERAEEMNDRNKQYRK